MALLADLVSFIHLRTMCDFIRLSPLRKTVFHDMISLIQSYLFYPGGYSIMWKLYAVLAAVFAALTAILAKIGIKGVDSNLATAIRTTVIIFLSWGIVLFTGAQKGLSGLSRHSWLFLVLSGIATGLSWLFYYKAISEGNVSQVAPIDKSSIALTLILSFLVLGEPFTVKTALAGGLIVAGTFVMLWK